MSEREHIHELVDRLDPNQLSLVSQLLERIVHDDEAEPATGEDRRRYHEGQAWFAQRGGQGIPMEEVLAEFGLKSEDFPLAK